MKHAALIQLNAKLDKLIEFRRYDEDGNPVDDGPGLGTVAAGAGILGAGYAGQSMYRGLKTMQGEYGGGLMPTSAGQAWTATKMGHSANMASLGGALSSGASTASAAAAPYTNAVKQAASTAGSGIQERLASMRAAQPFAKASGAVGGVIDRTARAGRQIGGFFSGLKAAGKYEVGKGGLGSLGSLSTLRRIGTRALTRGKFTYESKLDRLVQLNSRLDELIEFKEDDRKNHSGTGALVGGAMGLQAAQSQGAVARDGLAQFRKVSGASKLIGKDIPAGRLGRSAMAATLKNARRLGRGDVKTRLAWGAGTVGANALLGAGVGSLFSREG